MSDFHDDTRYYLGRANQEVAMAEQAEHSAAAAAHRELAMRYSVKALQLYADADAAGERFLFDDSARR